MHHFPDYNILRANRDTEYDLDDEGQLQSHGGSILLTSPDIVMLPKISFSNGNCEFLIAELPDLKLMLVLIYRPPIPNFSLPKFKDIVQRIETFLADPDYEHHNLILAGDLNFPPRIVLWVNSDSGIFADQKEGYSNEKIAFKMFMDMINNFNLEQLVDKPTRENALLDLVFSNCPMLLAQCSTKVVKPHSDHNLVNFVLNNCTNRENNQEAAELPEISTFNFKEANHETFGRALLQTNWNSLIVEAEIDNANNALACAIVEAAKASRVPKYRKTTNNKQSNKATRLSMEKQKLENQLHKKSLRDKDKQDIIIRLCNINNNICLLLSADEEKKEKKAIKEIKANPAAFYKYANSREQQEKHQNQNRPSKIRHKLRKRTKKNGRNIK